MSLKKRVLDSIHHDFKPSNYPEAIKIELQATKQLSSVDGRVNRMLKFMHDEMEDSSELEGLMKRLIDWRHDVSQHIEKNFKER